MRGGEEGSREMSQKHSQMTDFSLREFIVQLSLPFLALFSMVLPMISLAIVAAILYKIAAINAVLQCDIIKSGDAARGTYFIFCPIQLLPKRL